MNQSGSVKKTKLLITGSKGQLGTELLRLCGVGDPSLPGSAAHAAFGSRADAFEAVGVDLPELDITDLDAFRALAASVRPDVIINCAAYTNVDGCETNPDLAYAVNAVGARNAALAASSVAASSSPASAAPSVATAAKLIHISTDYVFDGQGSSPRREWDIPAPRSVYGLSKLAGENYAREQLAKTFIVRTAWLYGYNGSNFVKTILSAAKKGKPLKVVDDQIGNPTNALDLARQILALASTEFYGVYHCTCGGECCWYEFASEFLRLSGLEYTLEPCDTAAFPRPAPRPAYSALDNMALRASAGLERTMRPWREAIEEYMSDYKKGVFDV